MKKLLMALLLTFILSFTYSCSDPVGDPSSGDDGNDGGEIVNPEPDPDNPYPDNPDPEDHRIPIKLDNLNSLKGNYKIDNYTIKLKVIPPFGMSPVYEQSTPDSYLSVQYYKGDASIDVVDTDNLSIKALISNDATLSVLARDIKGQVQAMYGNFVPETLKFYINKNVKAPLSANKLGDINDNELMYEITAINTYSILLKYNKPTVTVGSGFMKGTIEESGEIFLTKVDDNILTPPKDEVLFYTPILTADNSSSIIGRYYLKSYTFAPQNYSINAGVQPNSDNVNLAPALLKPEQKDLPGLLTVSVDKISNKAKLKIAMQTQKEAGFYNDTINQVQYIYHDIEVDIEPTDNATAILSKLDGVIVDSKTLKFTFDKETSNTVNHSFKLNTGETAILEAVIMNDGDFIAYDNGTIRETPNRRFFGDGSDGDENGGDDGSGGNKDNETIELSKNWGDIIFISDPALPAPSDVTVADKVIYNKVTDTQEIYINTMTASNYKSYLTAIQGDSNLTRHKAISSSSAAGMNGAIGVGGVNNTNSATWVVTDNSSYYISIAYIGKESPTHDGVNFKITINKTDPFNKGDSSTESNLSMADAIGKISPITEFTAPAFTASQGEVVTFDDTKYGKEIRFEVEDTQANYTKFRNYLRKEGRFLWSPYTGLIHEAFLNKTHQKVGLPKDDHWTFYGTILIAFPYGVPETLSADMPTASWSFIDGDEYISFIWHGKDSPNNPNKNGKAIFIIERMTFDPMWFMP